MNTEEYANIVCTYGHDYCDPEYGDPEDMCEEHRLEAAEAWAEAKAETYDY
jgi:hypothetical protein